MSDMMETTKQQDAWHKACRRVGNDNMLSIGTWVAAYVDERLAADAAKAQPAEPRAEGDVPEWFGTAVRSIVLATDTMVRDAWSIASPHIARRVAEATAERNRRIAELDSIVADRTDMVKCVSDANSGLARHRDALKSQLAAVTAERDEAEANIGEVNQLLADTLSRTKSAEQQVERLTAELAAANARADGERARVADELEERAIKLRHTGWTDKANELVYVAGLIRGEHEKGGGDGRR